MSLQHLRLLQIADSLFPIGAYSFSEGLEVYAQSHLLPKESLLRLLTTGLRMGKGKGDALALKLTMEVLEQPNLEEVFELDTLLTAIKPVKAFRESSIRIGVRFLKTLQEVYPDPLLSQLLQAITQGKMQGHYAITYGAGCFILKIQPEEALQTYLSSWTLSMVSAAIRLFALGQIEGQRLIRDLHPVIQEVTCQVLTSKKEDLAPFTPALDIRGMQHEFLYTRLFRS
jgi:urease accessory protein